MLAPLSRCRTYGVLQVLPSGSIVPSSLSPALLDTLQRCSHLFTNPAALLQPGDHAQHGTAPGDAGEGSCTRAAPALTPALQAVIDAATAVAAAASATSGLQARGQGLGPGSSPERRAAAVRHHLADGGGTGGGGGGGANSTAVGPALGTLDTPDQLSNLTDNPSLNASVLAAAVARRLARRSSSSAGQAATGSSWGGGVSAGGGNSSGVRHPAGPQAQASPRSQTEAASTHDLHSAAKTSLSVLGNELLETTCARAQAGGSPMGSPRPSGPSTSLAAPRPGADVEEQEEAHHHRQQQRPGGMHAAHHHREQHDPQQQLEQPASSLGTGREQHHSQKQPNHPDTTPSTHPNPMTHGWRSVSTGRGMLAAGGGSARPRAPLPGTHAPRPSTQAGAPSSVPLQGLTRHPAVVPAEEHARLVELYKTQAVVSPRPGVTMVSLSPGMTDAGRDAATHPGSVHSAAREGGVGAVQRMGIFAGRAVFRNEPDAGTGAAGGVGGGSAAQATWQGGGAMPDRAAAPEGIGVRGGGGGGDGAVWGSRRLCMELLHEDDCFRMELLVKHLLACRPSQRGGGGGGGGGAASEMPGGGGCSAMWQKHAGTPSDSGAMVGGGGAGWGSGPGQQWGSRELISSARLSLGSGATYGMGRVARAAAEGRAAAVAQQARTWEQGAVSVQVERASCVELLGHEQQVLGAQGVRQSGASLRWAGSARDPLQPGVAMGPERRPPDSSSQGGVRGHSARRGGREQVVTKVGGVGTADPVEGPWRSPLGERAAGALEALRVSDKGTGTGQVRGSAVRLRPVSAPRVLQNRLGH